MSLEERRARRREALIRSAILLYGERGYRNSTVRAVCAAAGLTERYFYESFPNSEALLIASFQAVNRIVGACMQRASEACGEPGDDKVALILEAYFQTLKNSPDAARVFLVEIGGVSRAVDDIFRSAVDDFGLLLERTFEPAREKPESPSRSLLRSGVIGGVLHIALRWIASDYVLDVRTVAGEARRLCEVLHCDMARR